VARGLRISTWTTGVDQDGRQRDFLDEVRVFHTTGTYTSPDDLAQRVEGRLRAIPASALAPWVKVGNAVFRATSVYDDGRTITVVGRVRNNAVAASRGPTHRRLLREELRHPDHLPGGTSPVRFETVVSETMSSRVRQITLTADRTPETTSNLLEMAVNNRTPEGLTELSARVMFLGEPNPLDTMGFMVSGTNPCPAVEAAGLPEDAVEQVALLLVTELLVGERGVDHITSFRLGPRRAGHRRLRLAWMPRRRYTNEEPAGRSINGETPAVT
jgi:hypothetical protein